ncbi:transcription termination factor NusA [Texas Phoenix palm phytoplasma]|uniref:Transcription termination factor NusA n=2 Tax=Texas Phoenix palm phytoplasma TaxID=176709 RepID=A0ABS5BI90_9MOLU|nr:transcription termination factor NusA [Texas Phoenix palm phytoplasma]MBP3059303.1 transcription termination factor NusA [Texas Phoenix palm phytoplasma]
MKITKNFFNNIDKLAQEYDMEKEQIIKCFVQALIAGCKKHCQVKSCSVSFKKENDSFFLYKQYLVIDFSNEEIKNNGKKINFINLEEAKKITPKAELGQIIDVEVDPKSFNFNASKEFKNKFNEELIKQKRENIYNFFKNYENNLISAKVIGINKGFFTLELEKEVQVILTKKESLSNDDFYLGQRIQVFVVEVKNTTKMPKILVSRIRINFVLEIFKEFIPEINQGIIEIVSISRIPSVRMKVGLLSKDNKIDAIGSCIGEKNIRIKSIINVFKDEKIDLFAWSYETKELITNALKPAKIQKVEIINEKNKLASVFVNEQQIPLVIGKEGQNIKLASQVTKWNISVKSI